MFVVSRQFRMVMSNCYRTCMGNIEGGYRLKNVRKRKLSLLKLVWEVINMIEITPVFSPSFRHRVALI